MESELANLPNNIALFKSRLLVLAPMQRDMKKLYRDLYRDIFVNFNMIGRYTLDMMAVNMEHLISVIKKMHPEASVGAYIASLIDEQANYIETAYIKSYECMNI